jgi:CheY-like chemotaxis protein
LRTRSLPDGWIELTLTDTGKGMPPEVLARAMEPFFTTKAIGKGTGLGLAMAYATVKAHGGSMTLHSEVGRGTTVLVRLPAAKAPMANGPAALQMEAVGALRILQVDDDDLILASIPLLLELQGHAVTTATGGQEALDQLGGGLAVDLVILDLNMPGMNGLETLHRLRALRPALPVLLATGYLDPGTEAELRQFGHALSIAKPFSMQELNGMLKRLTAQESA